MLGALAIGALHDRVIEQRVRDGRLQAVDDHPEQRARKSLKRVAMAQSWQRQKRTVHAGAGTMVGEAQFA